MELLLKRLIKTDNSTIGELSINGVFECYILEDPDRGLTSEMSLEEIKERKIKERTAIPTGRYQVIFNYSNKFKKFMPLLLNVKGFEGIRIHKGNVPVDTEGCLLPGLVIKKDCVLQSKNAFEPLEKKLYKAFKIEKVYITIQ